MKSVSEAIGEKPKTTSVSRRDARGRLGLDADNASIGMLKDEVDLRAISISKVPTGGAVWAPTELFADLHRHKRLKKWAERHGWVHGALQGGSGKMSGEAAVDDNELGAADDLLREVARPSGDQLNHKEIRKQGKVTIECPWGYAEIVGKARDIQLLAASSSTQANDARDVGNALNARDISNELFGQ